MVILDTNVISELLAPKPNSSVEGWLAAQPIASVFTTAITKAEILRGVRFLPEGRRRRDLETAIRPIFTTEFEGRVLPFDAEAAEAYADLTAARRTVGRPISQSDAEIAAIALSRGSAVATRTWTISPILA
ncbi:MAG TPA: type II toxin-antitoxin system VapC family toxin [Roseiarcus sp.]|nr:type II toxin-antitoxin system VapC family toxin [Roseiarcus sp.]